MSDEEIKNVKVRGTSVECIAHPEWGMFGIMEDHGLWWDIQGDRGSRVLSKDEARQFWRIARRG